jgi:hypothetical protein
VRIESAFSREIVVIRPWQPAVPQAMQRHGGRTRPADERAAKAEAMPASEGARDDDRTDAHGGTAPDKPSKSNE